MERGEWEQEPEYPRAPLPKHERAWRHPSELGETNWVLTEPPLVVGRGLSIATGAVGAVLALGLLWLMIPHQDGGGVATESSMTTDRDVDGLASPTSREVGATPSTASSSTPFVSSLTTLAPTTDLAGSGSTTADSAPVTTPTSAPASSTDSTTATSGPSTAPETTEAPPSTVAPDASALTTSTAANPPNTIAAPVAVALTPGRLIVTTAAAVAGREGVPVTLRSGQTVTAAVVAVDTITGVAVLSVPDGTDAEMIEPSEIQVSTDPLSATADDRPVTVWNDDSGTQVGYDGEGEPTEGSLVLDTDGKLMGMCTKSANGIHLVPVATLISALDAAANATGPAWLGIKADVGSGGIVTLLEVLASGPAAAAGLQPGDVIQAVDGAPITDLDSLRTSISVHAPGDTVQLTIGRSGVAPFVQSVTLSQQPSSF